MPLVTIHNLLQTKLALPIGKLLAARESITLTLSSDALETSGLSDLERAGHIDVVVAPDTTVGETRSVWSSEIGVIDVTVGAEDAGVITLTCAILDLSGQALAGVRHVMVQTIADTDAQGAIGETVAPIGSVVNIKPDADTVGSFAWIRTETDGTFDFTVTDALAETCAVRISADGCLVRVVELTFAGP